MDTHQLLERIAHLEFVNDQISMELQETDKLLRMIGFSEGLHSVKKAALEIYNFEQNMQGGGGLEPHS